jgi:glycosyltransferase involved in cell wall biosynthesis
MKVSVLIPVYNKAPYLKDCLDSVFNGTWTDLEVLAVDDASTDDSLVVLKGCSDPRLRIIALPTNLGPAGAANRGLDEAQGEYIVRLDADDLNAPDRIAKQVAYMEAHPEVGASGGALTLFGSTTVTWSFPLTNDEAQAQLLFGVPVSQGASILRRSVIEQHHLRYDPSWPRIGEDWLFWARMSRVTAFGNLPDALTLYRRGEQNISHGRDKVKDHKVILHALFASLDIPLTDAHLELHLMALKLFQRPPTAERIRALRGWLDTLLALNNERALFPKVAFAQRVERAWSELYHYLSKYGVGVALEHLRLSGAFPWDRVSYLAKVRMRSIFDRLTSKGTRSLLLIAALSMVLCISLSTDAYAYFFDRKFFEGSIVLGQVLVFDVVAAFIALVSWNGWEPLVRQVSRAQMVSVTLISFLGIRLPLLLLPPLTMVFSIWFIRKALRS